MPAKDLDITVYYMMLLDHTVHHTSQVMSMMTKVVRKELDKGRDNGNRGRGGSGRRMGDSGRGQGRRNMHGARNKRRG